MPDSASQANAGDCPGARAGGTRVVFAVLCAERRGPVRGPVVALQVRQVFRQGDSGDSQAPGLATGNRAPPPECEPNGSAFGMGRGVPVRAVRGPDASWTAAFETSEARGNPARAGAGLRSRTRTRFALVLLSETFPHFKPRIPQPRANEAYFRARRFAAQVIYPSEPIASPTGACSQTARGYSLLGMTQATATACDRFGEYSGSVASEAHGISHSARMRSLRVQVSSQRRRLPPLMPNRSSSRSAGWSSPNFAEKQAGEAAAFTSFPDPEE